MTSEQLTAVKDGGPWRFDGTAADRFGLVNEFLRYLTDRNFSPRTCRTYAYDLLAFARWLDAERVGLGDVDVDVLLRVLSGPRGDATRPPGGKRVFDPRRSQHRLCADDGQPPVRRDLRPFAFREMRDPMPAIRLRVVGPPGCAPGANGPGFSH